MNIALYGGSFDPPHLGHIHVVHAALKSLDIDRVIVVPAFVNPFKSGTHAPAELRLKWLQKIFYDDENVEVSDIEVRENRAVRSIETVKQFAAVYEKIYFIIGADNLASLEQWYRFDELNTLVTWVVATRDKIEIADKYIQLAVEQPISSSELREELNEEHLPKEVVLEIKTFYETNKESHARSH